VRHTQLSAEADAVASVGSTGDCCDNALAEAFDSIFKAELIRNKRSRRGVDDLEIAVTEYIDWYDHRRLHGEPGTWHRRLSDRYLAVDSFVWHARDQR
jgi:putative transposase